MNPVRALLLPAAACLMAIATPALAQDASAGAHGHHRSRAAAPSVRRVSDAIPAAATAEVGGIELPSRDLLYRRHH